MRFNAAVERACWDEVVSCWRITVAGGEPVTARYLVTATGFLSQPRRPDIPGIDAFAGKLIHTAAWDRSYDLTGRRAAVIGTGSTAVQLIPKLADDVAELTVYQRTPIWVVPTVDTSITPGLRALFARLPIVQRAARAVSTSVLELMMISAVLHFRQAKVLNAGAARLARRHLRRQVPDPVLRRELPPDYDFGCKRPTFSNSCYRAFTRPNVHLETTGIERIGAEEIVTCDGRSTPIDTIVLAIGFNIWDINFPAFPILGRGGHNLGQWWRDNRFPNYLTLASPYSALGDQLAEKSRSDPEGLIALTRSSVVRLHRDRAEAVWR
jgi:cation diffusion facilitator CzcD-associated flavoprotein CzcO